MKPPAPLSPALVSSALAPWHRPESQRAMRWGGMGLFMVVLVFLLWGTPLEAYTERDHASATSRGLLAVGMLDKFQLDEVLGPLGPIALSPFFGLACLSLLGLLSRDGVIPPNDLLTGHPILTNEVVCAGLFGLAVLTALPRLTKVSKPVAQALEQLESNAAMISYAAILFLAQIPFEASGAGAVAAASPEPMRAGLLDWPLEALLALACALNIFVINAVKVFFDFLIWLSPIPLIDAAFEGAKLSIVGGLSALYAFSPWLAALVNLLLFACCLVIFVWVKRRTTFYRAVLGEVPLKKALGMIGFQDYHPDRKQLEKLRAQAGEGAVAVKVFPNRKWKGLPKRARCYLVATPQKAELIRPRLIGGTQRKPLPEGLRRLSSSFLVNSVEVHDPKKKKPYKLHFSHLNDDLRPQLAEALGASSDFATAHASEAPPVSSIAALA